MSRRRALRRHLATTLAGAFLVLCAEGAHAAPPPGGASATSGASAATTERAGEEASTHFKRGLQLFDDGEYTLALVEFERAYQLAPNYRALYNIALVDVQLGRYADAAHTLEQYLHDGGDAVAPARRAEVTKTLGHFKLRTATIDISMNVAGADVTLDGKPIDSARLRGPMVIDAGEHTLRATAPGYLANDRTVTLAGGDRAAVRLELRAFNQPQHVETPHARGPFWPGFALTGALAAGAIASGVVMAEDRAHLSQLQNTPGSDATQRASTANSANTTALVADILSGLAVVAGGVSLYISLSPEHAAKSPSVAISPQKVVFLMPF